MDITFDTTFWIESIGWLGTAILLTSMTQSNMLRLRVINLVGTVIMLSYVIMISAHPMMVFNAAMFIVNLWHIIAIMRKKSAESADVEEETTEEEVEEVEKAKVPLH